MIHENRGLNPHIEDIARRLALDNFVAFAPDALFPLGGYPGDEDKARELFPKLDQAKTREDFVAAARVAQGAARKPPARSAPSASATAAAWSTIWRRSCPTSPPASPFYGSAPNIEDVPKIKAPLLIQSAEVDERINASWPAYETALKAANVQVTSASSTRAHSTASTTTRRRATTRLRPSWRGSGRLPTSTSIFAREWQGGAPPRQV